MAKLEVEYSSKHKDFSMKALARTLLTVTLVTQSALLCAGNSSHVGQRSIFAERCLAQTEKARYGKDPAKLSIESCNRALREGPYTNENKSAVYHNRAIIELAKGNSSAARKSLELAVTLAPEVGLQHIALAQLAHRQGDYLVASQFYDALLGANTSNRVVADNRELLQRNRDRVQDKLARQQISQVK